MVKVSAKELKKVLSETITNCSKDISKGVLNCISFTIKDNTLELHSTDGYRLLQKQISVKSDSNYSFLVPCGQIKELIKFLAKKKNEVDLIIKNNELIISCLNEILTLNCLTGNYPEVKRVIPNFSSYAIKFKLDQSKLIKILKENNKKTKDKVVIVNLLLEEEKILIKYDYYTEDENKNKKRIIETFECKSEVIRYKELLSDFKINLNSRFLENCLDKCFDKSTELEFLYFDSFRPFSITEKNNYENFSLIMPTRP